MIYLLQFYSVYSVLFQSMKIYVNKYLQENEQVVKGDLRVKMLMLLSFMTFMTLDFQFSVSPQ